jgi:hypothetical protein
VSGNGQRTLADLFGAIRIESPQAFTVGGRTFNVPPAPVQPAPAAGQAAPEQTPPLVEWLSGVLYRYAYTRPFRPPLPLDDPPATAMVDEALAAELSAANASRDHWEDGWSITQIHSSGEITVQRGNATRNVWPGQFLSKDGPGMPPRTGTHVSLFYPRESTSLQPGFYYCFGETPEDTAGGFGVARAYWNVTAEGAPRLVGLLSERLNRFQVPFRLKCATLRGEYGRTDVAVLYLVKRLFPFLGEVVRDVYPELRPFLGEDVPLFARRFAAGVGIAEDPGNGESFGQHRCRVLAETCWSGFLRGDQRPESLLAEFRQRLAAAGTDPERAYLNSGSLDLYDPPPGLENGAAPLAVPAPVPDRGREEEFLEVAVALGARVCRDAFWAGDRCNWTGFSMESLDGRWRQTHRAYGPDVYAGTSGIGLFLARLHAVTGEPLFRRTALGALRNALARAEDVEPFSRIGAWSGWTGLSLAVLQAAALLDEDFLREPALALLGRVAAGEVELQTLDVLAGCAGAIPALLFVQRNLGGPDSLLDAAVRLGDHLIGKATRSDVGWSWGEISPGSGQKGNLTGFSHGAGGIGWSLIELWNATREERFRRAGEEAFRYERHWYDPERRNWPDLRDPTLSGGPPSDAPSFMSAWCHGAPGIGLGRLRAWQITGDPAIRAEAEAALANTYDHVLGGQEMSQTNYCLCHGLGGNCDMLLQGTQVLGNPEWQRRAEEIARRGIETHHAQKLPWPCGTYGSVEVPGLMLGLSGIGWFYLRLADPEVPSALIVVPG